MLRDKSLIPLSHQHQHALALCVRLNRALASAPLNEAARPAWEKDIAQIFDQEICCHFAAEEKFLFPRAAQYAALKALVSELLQQHKILLMYAENARAALLDDTGLHGFAEALAGHIRQEERELFEACQSLMPAAELAETGALIVAFFRAHGVLLDACALPGEAASP